MRLHAAATRFDKSVLTDAYTDELIGKGQLEHTDIFKLDGASVRRRIMSVSPTLSIPARRAIQIAGEKYLVGEPSFDESFGSLIRVKYVLHRTPGEASVYSIEGALAEDAATTTAFASREWNKDVVDMRESSRYINDYHIFFGKNESVNVNDLIYIDGTWHYCHSVHPSLSGFRDAVSHELIGSVFEVGTASSKTYTAQGDSFSSVDSEVRMLRMRWSEDFTYFTESQTDYVRGDETVMFLEIDWPNVKVSDEIEFTDGFWKVLSVVDSGSVRRLHTRRV